MEPLGNDDVGNPPWGKLTRKQCAQQREAELRELLCAWDPIGVMDDQDWPRDEYDCLMGPILRMLDYGSTQKELAIYLKKQIKNHFGLNPIHYNFKAVAATFYDWHTDRQTD